MHRPNVRMVNREEVVTVVERAKHKELLKAIQQPEQLYGWILVAVLLIGAVVIAALPPF